jgi:hypothetical protein
MADVCARSYEEHLSGLSEASLIALLQARPDVLVQPVPRGFSQLAQRLDGAESLAAALRTANRDMVMLGRPPSPWAPRRQFQLSRSCSTRQSRQCELA